MYAKILNNSVAKYPFTFEDLQKENPYTKYELDVNLVQIYPRTQTGLTENSYLVPVSLSPQPTFDASTQKVVEVDPVCVNDQWVQSWAVVVMTEQERTLAHDEKSSEVRKIRNELLIKSDWTQLKDVPGAISDSFSLYRQQLRDIPQQPGFPWNVSWPEVITTGE